jgi:aryl-alcohol dehydrogenase-like predicted oxidoreductase
MRWAVTSPIVGASRIEHLSDAVAATTLQLSADEIQALEAHYAPRRVGAFIQ